MSVREYTFQIITPVVMAGAYNRSPEIPELRTASIKGILRWWFRFYKACFVDSIQKLKEEEDKVFGSMENASPYQMKLQNIPANTTDAYLRMNDRSNRNIKRKAYNISQTFTLQINHIYPLPDDLQTSIKLLSLFGGIGARWRRAFGSVQTEEYTPEGKSLGEIAKSIERILGIRCQSADYPHINNFMNITNTDIYLLKPKSGFWNSWESAMDELRDKFYRPLKKYLGTRRLDFKPHGGERAVSPVIIQIKRSRQNQYFGVIMVYRGWNEHNRFKNFWNNLHSFDKKEVKL